MSLIQTGNFPIGHFLNVPIIAFKNPIIGSFVQIRSELKFLGEVVLSGKIVSDEKKYIAVT